MALQCNFCQHSSWFCQAILMESPIPPYVSRADYSTSVTLPSLKMTFMPL